MAVEPISLFGTRKNPKPIKEILARYGAPEAKVKARKTHYKIT